MKYMLIVAINFKYTGLVLAHFKFETKEEAVLYWEDFEKSTLIDEVAKNVITGYEHEITTI